MESQQHQGLTESNTEAFVENMTGKNNRSEDRGTGGIRFLVQRCSVLKFPLHAAKGVQLSIVLWTTAMFLTSGTRFVTSFLPTNPLGNAPVPKSASTTMSVVDTAAVNGIHDFCMCRCSRWFRKRGGLCK